MNLAHLPGGDLVAKGLRDVERGIESEAALLVRIGAPRLRRLGLPVPPIATCTGPFPRRSIACTPGWPLATLIRRIRATTR
jgi:hypothetical protein